MSSVKKSTSTYLNKINLNESVMIVCNKNKTHKINIDEELDDTIKDKEYDRNSDDESESDDDTIDSNYDPDELENKFKSGIFNQLLYIKEFSERECSLHNLSCEICNSLIETINTLFAEKTLTSKSIMSNKHTKKIDFIYGLTINKSGFFLNKSKMISGKKKYNKNDIEKQKTFKSSNRLSKTETKFKKD